MTEAPQYDPNMELARRLAEGLGRPPDLPASLHDIKTRCRLVSEIDGPLLMGNTPEDCMEHLGKRIAAIAVSARKRMPDIGDPLMRLNIALRLWSGCLSAAKTIALETRSGPNTPELRQRGFERFDAIAQNDPVYRAGVETAPAFKKCRQESYSFEGVSVESPVRKYP